MRTLTHVFVVLLFLASCSTTKDLKKESNALQTKVRVENRNISRMTIYALKRSERIRLGAVSGHLTETFVIPDHLVGGATPLRLLADPVGSNKNPVSEEFIVRPGDVIEMTIRAF